MSTTLLGFPRSRRLTSSADFQRVFDRAAKSSDNQLTVLARANQMNHPRLGLAISKKNIRQANDRNRLKRIIRESFRLNQQNLAGIDFIIMARTAALQADHETLFRSLHKHWAHLVKQCKPSWSPSSRSTAT
ncbi:MAG: ribonuclease P protein component [Methylococcaceae bacterium]